MSEKVIGLKVFQPYAQFRNPLTFYYAQTYPLPPKTSIIGFLQNLLGRYYDEDLWEIKVSIHGGFSTYFWNYQNLIKGDIAIGLVNGKPGLINQNLPLYHFPMKSQRSPVYQQELFNGHYYLFLKGDSSTIDSILGVIERPPFVMRIGRSEDVIFIRKIYTREQDNLIYNEDNEPADFFSYRYPTYLLLDDFKGKRLNIEDMNFPVYLMPLKIEFHLESERVSISNIGELMLLRKKIIRVPKFVKIIYVGSDSALELTEPQAYDELIIQDGKKKLKIEIIREFGWL